MPPRVEAASEELTDSDKAHLRRLLHRTNQQLAEAEAVIRERTPIRNAVLAHLETVRYPGAATLSPSILSIIFAYTVESAEMGEAFTFRPYPAIRAVASVCRAWRAVALDCKQIWANIEVRGKPDSSSGEPTFLQALDLWIQRGGTNELALDLSRAMGESTVSAVLPHAGRVHELSLAFYNDSVYLDGLRGRVPALRTVKLTGNAPASFSTFSDAPLLRTVHLANFQYSAKTLPWAVVGLPWAQLTAVHLKEVAKQDCLDVLRQTPLLETLSVGEYLKYSNQTVAQAAQPLELTQLRTLITKDASLLNVLTLPALKDLDICAVQNRDELDTDKFFSRSNCPLETLKVTKIQSLELCQILKKIPTLVELTATEIPAAYYSEHGFFVEFLANHLYAVPKLRKLHVLNPLSPGREYSRVGELLTNRNGDREGVGGLQEFRFVASNAAFIDPYSSENMDEDDVVQTGVVLREVAKAGKCKILVELHGPCVHINSDEPASFLSNSEADWKRSTSLPVVMVEKRSGYSSHWC